MKPVPLETIVREYNATLAAAKQQHPNYELNMTLDEYIASVRADEAAIIEEIKTIDEGTATGSQRQNTKVYLCGPINGCTDEECNDWRAAAKQFYPNAIDPMVRDYRGREEECYDEIVELDKIDIENSDALLVNYDKPSVGTSMEVFFAWQDLCKPVVVMCKSGTSISPWLRYHSDAIVHTLKDAVAKIDYIVEQRKIDDEQYS